jgi:hypothetical protein
MVITHRDHIIPIALSALKPPQAGWNNLKEEQLRAQTLNSRKRVTGSGALLFMLFFRAENGII